MLINAGILLVVVGAWIDAERDRRRFKRERDYWHDCYQVILDEHVALLAARATDTENADAK